MPSQSQRRIDTKRKKRSGLRESRQKAEEVGTPEGEPKPYVTGTTKRRAHSSDDKRSLVGSNNNETIEEDFNTARTVEEEKTRKRAKRHLQKQTKEQNERDMHGSPHHREEVPKKNRNSKC